MTLAIALQWAKMIWSNLRLALVLPFEKKRTKAMVDILQYNVDNLKDVLNNEKKAAEITKDIVLKFFEVKGFNLVVFQEFNSYELCSVQFVKDGYYKVSENEDGTHTVEPTPLNPDLVKNKVIFLDSETVLEDA